MWCRVIAVLAVACVAAGHDHVTQDTNSPTGFGRYLEPRLGSSGLRLARLEKELGDVAKRIAEAKKVDPQGFINDLNDRIDHVEAITDHCDSTKEVRCGHDTEECVNTLLLCDGQKDCHNGWDEDSKTCSAGPVKSGNVFTGTAEWVSCQSRHDHPVKVTITGVAKANFFGARLIVRGKVAADFVDDPDHEDHREFEVKGYYVFGKKRLALFPADRSTAAREHLGVVCDFVHGNDVTAECQFTHEGSLLTCAKFHATLQQ